MRESLNVMSQCLDFLYYFDKFNNKEFIINNNKLAPPSRILMKLSMSH